MADTAARLALSARRNEVARFTIAVNGIDLTDVPMAMQIRLGRDVPGAPLIALTKVETLAAEGLKLDSVTATGGVPTSIIKGRINQSTMTDAAKVPYMGEIGSDSVLAYAMQWTLGGDAQTRLYGDFVVLGSAFGSDNAPTNRPPIYGAPSSAGGSSSGSLTFGDQVIRVSIDGAEYLRELLGGTVADREAVAADRAAVAADRGLVVAGAATVAAALPVIVEARTTTVAAAATARADAIATGADAAQTRSDRAAVQAAIDAQTIWRFVDATTGSDTADGLTAATAWRTDAPLRALGPGIAGKTIGLARGSEFTSAIRLVSDRVRIRPYGDPALPAPMVDPSIVLRDWLPVIGKPDHYTATATMYDDLKNLGNVFRHGTAVALRLSVAAIAAFDYAANVDIWRVVVNSEGKPNLIQDGTNATITIHSVTDPRNDGSEWRIANDNCIDIIGDDADIAGIDTRRAAHQDGAIKTRRRPVIRYCSASDCSRHGVYTGIDPVVEYCMIGEGSRNDLEDGNFDALVVNEPIVTGSSITTRGNTFFAAVYGHGGEGSGPFGVVRHIDDTWVGARVCVIGIAQDHRAIRPHMVGVDTFYQGGNAGAHMVVENATGTANRMAELSGAVVYSSVTAKVTVPALNSVLRVFPENSAPTVSIDGDEYTILTAPASVPAPAILPVPSGRLIVRNLRVLGPDGRVLHAPARDMIRVGAAVELSGGNNGWAFGGRYQRGDTAYASLAAFQAADFELGSVTPQPKAPYYTDTFNRPDELLEAAGSGWTILDGSAATAAVRGNGLAIIRSDARTAYAGGQAASTDAYMRFTVVSPDWSETVLCIAVVNLQTFLGLRVFNGSYQLVAAAGTVEPVKLAEFGVTAAGDDVVVERFGTQIRVYVNGATIIDMEAGNPAYNDVRTFGLISWLGVRTILDNLRVGDL